MNSACALSGVVTVHPPCAFYRHFDPRLGDAILMIRLIARAPGRGRLRLAALTHPSGFGAFSTDQVAGTSNAKTVKMISRLRSNGLPNTYRKRVSPSMVGPRLQ
jgi:hypothetical protein